MTATRLYCLRSFQFFFFRLVAAPFLCFAGEVGAETGAEKTPVGERNVDGIYDNSFLVEEAYNQEKNVIQHIFNGFYSRTHQPGSDVDLLNLTFTQEWPVFSQTHQFSYTIPYNIVRSGGQTEEGFGDVLLNYRYQAYFNPETLMAFAPRASIVLPTGSVARNLGDNTVGCQFNLPFSTAIGDKWVSHLNAGLTYLPSAASAQNRDLTSFNFGASAIYAATRDTHFMLEWVGNWVQFGESGAPKRREFISLLSPGVRHAFDFANESQLVIGAAVPVGLTGPSPEVGVFLYVSFEHFLFRKKE
jgi:hypothetical protein